MAPRNLYFLRGRLALVAIVLAMSFLITPWLVCDVMPRDGGKDPSVPVGDITHSNSPKTAYNPGDYPGVTYSLPPDHEIEDNEVLTGSIHLTAGLWGFSSLSLTVIAGDAGGNPLPTDIPPFSGELEVIVWSDLPDSQALSVGFGIESDLVYNRGTMGYGQLYSLSSLNVNSFTLFFMIVKPWPLTGLPASAPVVPWTIGEVMHHEGLNWSHTITLTTWVQNEANLEVPLDQQRRHVAMKDDDTTPPTVTVECNPAIIIDHPGMGDATITVTGKDDFHGGSVKYYVTADDQQITPWVTFNFPAVQGSSTVTIPAAVLSDHAGEKLRVWYDARDADSDFSPYNAFTGGDPLPMVDEISTGWLCSAPIPIYDKSGPALIPRKYVPVGGGWEWQNFTPSTEPLSQYQQLGLSIAMINANDVPLNFTFVSAYLTYDQAGMPKSFAFLELIDNITIPNTNYIHITGLPFWTWDWDSAKDISNLQLTAIATCGGVNISVTENIPIKAILPVTIRYVGLRVSDCYDLKYWNPDLEAILSYLNASNKPTRVRFLFEINNPNELPVILRGSKGSEISTLPSLFPEGEVIFNIPAHTKKILISPWQSTTPEDFQFIERLPNYDDLMREVDFFGSLSQRAGIAGWLLSKIPKYAAAAGVLKLASGVFSIAKALTLLELNTSLYLHRSESLINPYIAIEEVRLIKNNEGAFQDIQTTCFPEVGDRFVPCSTLCFTASDSQWNYYYSMINHINSAAFCNIISGVFKFVGLLPIPGGSIFFGICSMAMSTAAYFNQVAVEQDFYNANHLDPPEDYTSVYIPVLPHPVNSTGMPLADEMISATQTLEMFEDAVAHTKERYYQAIAAGDNVSVEVQHAALETYLGNYTASLQAYRAVSNETVAQLGNLTQTYDIPVETLNMTEVVDIVTSNLETAGYPTNGTVLASLPTLQNVTFEFLYENHVNLTAQEVNFGRPEVLGSPKDMTVNITSINFPSQFADSAGAIIPLTLHASSYFGIDNVTVNYGGVFYNMTFIDRLYHFPSSLMEDTYQLDLPNPRFPGNYTVTMTVWDVDPDNPNEHNSTTQEITILVYDDTPDAPIIHSVEIVNMDGGAVIFDNMSYFVVKVRATSSEGIEKVMVGTFSGSWYGDFTLVHIEGDLYQAQIPSGQRAGNYSMHLTVWDTDNDYPGDQNITSLDVPYTIKDDCVIPPVIVGLECLDALSSNSTTIVITDDPSYLQIRIYASSEAGIDSVLVGWGDWAFYAWSNEGYWQVGMQNPTIPGTYILHVEVKDADLDPVSIPWDDQLKSERNWTLIVLDDDQSVPVIEHYSIVDSIYATDYGTTLPDNVDPFFVKVLVHDSAGVYNVTVELNGAVYVCGNVSDTWGARLPNPRTLGNYKVHVVVWDADLDGGRLEDQLSTTGDFYFSVINAAPQVRTFFMNGTSTGDYWGTFTFSGRDLTPFPRGWTFITQPAVAVSSDYWNILPSYEGHSDVLQLYKNASIATLMGVYANSGGITSGTVEFWASLSAGPEIIGGVGMVGEHGPLEWVGFQAGELVAIDYQLGILSFGAVEPGWHHVRVEFNETEMRISLDGTLRGATPIATPSPVVSIGVAIGDLAGGNGTGALYLDALGVSWDSHYAIGANMQELGIDLAPIDASGEYRGTYTFARNDVNRFIQDTMVVGTGNIPTDLYFALTSALLGEYDGHQTVLHLEAHRVYNPLGLFQNIDPPVTEGTIEFWANLDENGGAFAPILGQLGGISPQFCLLFIVQRGIIFALNPDQSITVLGTIEEGTWHHYRIDFAGIGSTYLGLEENHFMLHIDQEYIGNFSAALPSILNVVGFYVGMLDNSVSRADAYFDAIGFSWDAGYHLGDNLVLGPPPEIPTILLDGNELDTSLSWMPVDVNYDTPHYTISCNGAPVATGAWDSGSSISLNISTLAPGDHHFDLTLEDGLGGTATTYIAVHVISNSPQLLDMIDALINMVIVSDDADWRNPAGNRKAEMIGKLGDVRSLVEEGHCADAYDLLLHDIKPKLTGLKTDEDEVPWGNGVERQPWVTNPELQQAFRDQVNPVLRGIKALAPSTPEPPCHGHHAGHCHAPHHHAGQGHGHASNHGRGHQGHCR